MNDSIAQRGRFERAGARNAALMIAAAVAVATAVALWIGFRNHDPRPSAPAAVLQMASPADTAGGPSWGSLSDVQQATLRPLMDLWPTLDSSRKQRWIEAAARIRHLSRDAQARVQSRMAAWAKLTPKERDQIRLAYLFAKHLPTAERKLRWSKYQSGPREPTPKRTTATTLAALAPATVRINPGATTVVMTELPGARTGDAAHPYESGNTVGLPP